MTFKWTSRRREFAALALLLGLALVLLAAQRVGAPRSLPGPQLDVPSDQQLVANGTVWLISDAEPRIVNFTSPASGQIWMNFSVEGGGVSVELCPITATDIELGSSQCYSGGGGIEHAIGKFQQWWNATVYDAELVFINYGPSSESDPVIQLTWSSPLIVQAI